MDGDYAPLYEDKEEKIVLGYAYAIGRIDLGIQYAYAEQEKNRKFWDRLVDLDREHDISIVAAASVDDDRLVFLRDEIYFASLVASEAIEARAEERGRLRARMVADSFNEAVNAAFQRLRAARKEFNSRLNAWKKDHSAEVKQFVARRYENIKIARNESELWWPNYNRVIASFESARAQCNKMGRKLRYSDPMRSDGCLAVQIQKTRTGYGASPDELLDGVYPGLQIRRVPKMAHDKSVSTRAQRRHLCQTKFIMRVDSEGRMVTGTIWFHRPLPKDCRIKAAQLTWKDGGARGRKWQLVLIITQPKPKIVHANPNDAIGVDVGWRVMDDGGLRVAMCAGTLDGTEELRIPARWMRHQDWIEKLRSDIDLGKIKGEKNVRHAELKIKGGLAKDRGERREIYRLFARRLAMRYGVIAIEHIELAVLAMHAVSIGGNQRHRACCHQLLDEFRHQCEKHGSRLIEMSGPSTMQCHACGKVGEPVDRAMLFWTCEGCGIHWDQDHNAAVNLMLAAKVVTATEEAGGGTVDSKSLVEPARPGKRKRSPRREESILL